MSCFFFHKWSKWEPYIEHSTKVATGILFPADIRGKPLEVTKKRQKRRCEKCDRIQDRLIGICSINLHIKKIGRKRRRELICVEPR